jgi:flagellar hook-length control protein FliK
VPPTFSVSTSISVAPPAPAAPAGGAAVLGAPGLPQADSGAADFLGQFKAALKNLTKAGTKPHLATQLAPQMAPDQSPGPDAAPAIVAEPKPVDHKADPLPDVLAALGFVPVPIAFQPPVTPPEKTADAPTPSASVVPGALAVPVPADLTLPGQPVTASNATTLVGSSKADAPKPTSPTPATPTPTPAAPSTNDPAPLVPGNLVQTPSAPAAHQAATPPSASDATTQVIAAQQTAQQGGSQHSGAKDDGQSSSEKTSAVTDSAAVQGQGQISDAAIAVAAGSTITNSVTAVVPAHVRPAEVVAQIAHQSDLYRLPGNRGVRIQLHPEGLGGVEVTMRYGVGGALQLHINVEHAATGSLVQAGWTQLRDALATQGISPDRLVMSVTAPTSSTQLDFSGGGSGRQTDPGLAGFAQSQSGQQRRDQPEQTGQRGWNGAVEPTSPSDDNPRVASTTAVTSRIDYRA